MSLRINLTTKYVNGNLIYESYSDRCVCFAKERREICTTGYVEPQQLTNHTWHNLSTCSTITVVNNVISCLFLFTCELPALVLPGRRNDSAYKPLIQCFVLRSCQYGACENSMTWLKVIDSPCMRLFLRFQRQSALKRNRTSTVSPVF